MGAITYSHAFKKFVLMIILLLVCVWCVHVCLCVCFEGSCMGRSEGNFIAVHLLLPHLKGFLGSDSGYQTLQNVPLPNESFC